MIKTVVIPIAGKGSRFFPITQTVSKEMLPIINRPMMDYVLEEFYEAGVTKIIFISSPYKKDILEYYSKDFSFIKKQGLQLEIVEQTTPLGLGHAILQAKKILKGKDKGKEEEYFFIGLPDDLFFGESEQQPSKKEGAAFQLLQHFKEKQTNLIGVISIPREDSKLYGVVVPKEQIDQKGFLIKGMKEKPAPEESPSLFATPGRYIFHSKTLFHFLEKIQPGALGEYQLTDAIDLLCRDESVYAIPLKGKRLDAGNPTGFLNTTLHFYLQHPQYQKEAQEIIRKYYVQNS